MYNVADASADKMMTFELRGGLRDPKVATGCRQRVLIDPRSAPAPFTEWSAGDAKD